MEFKVRDQGENVKRIQSALNSFGFDLKIDGDFYKKTEQAVRKFQRSNGLKVDGKVGKNTLTALGLDPETLEELSPVGDDGTIVFTDEEANDLSDVELPPDLVRQDINTYVERIEEQFNKLVISMLQALSNFQASMTFDSEEDARPDVFGSLLSTAFDYGAGLVLEHIPGGDLAKEIFDAATEEFERAGNASQSLKAGIWIERQREILGNKIIQNTQQQWDRLKFKIEDDFLACDPQGRKELWEQIHNANEKMSGPPNYTMVTLQAKLYEEFINAHYKDNWDEDSLSGCIEYRLEFEDDEFNYKSCRVRAPLGDHIETALNRFLKEGKLRGILLPIDFKVRKRVCLKTEDYVPGGRDWFCGWLDADNNVTREPIKKEAVRGFRSPVWRKWMKHFGEY